MKKVKIYDERFTNGEIARFHTYESKEEAIDSFIEYNRTNNTEFDGMEDDEILEEITLYNIADEYWGSWGRVKYIDE